MNTCNDLDRLFGEARRQQSAGAYAEARELYYKVLKSSPEHWEALYWAGIACLQEDTQQLSLAREAHRLLSTAAKLRPGHWSTHFHLGIAMSMKGFHGDAISHYLSAVALNPSHAASHLMLGRAYFINDDISSARKALERAYELDPLNSEILDEIENIKALCGRDIPVRRWPSKISKLADKAGAFKSFLLPNSITYPKILTHDSVVTTFGSCFAGNLARALREVGLEARNVTVGEAINSTFANKAYVSWVLGEASERTSTSVEKLTDSTPETHRQIFEETDLFVITLGVSGCFFDRQTGDFVMPRASQINHRALAETYEYRLTTVQENRDNLLWSLESIRKLNSSASVVLTLSPVPLMASFSSESAVVTDCASKGILRTTIEEVMARKPENVYYWPSFEFVRWLGVYWGDTYGEEDGSTHHVSEWAIKTIVDGFVDSFRGPSMNINNLLDA